MLTPRFFLALTPLVILLAFPSNCVQAAPIGGVAVLGENDLTSSRPDRASTASSSASNPSLAADFTALELASSVTYPHAAHDSDAAPVAVASQADSLTADLEDEIREIKQELEELEESLEEFLNREGITEIGGEAVDITHLLSSSSSTDNQLSFSSPPSSDSTRSPSASRRKLLLPDSPTLEAFMKEHGLSSSLPTSPPSEHHQHDAPSPAVRKTNRRTRAARQGSESLEGYLKRKDIVWNGEVAS